MKDETPPPELLARRWRRWRQTPDTRFQKGAADAPAFLEQVGLATLFPVSSEVPNLLHAYLGDPDAPTDAKWDSPAGEVYTWRWTLGHQNTAFYTSLVKGRPTYIAWPLLPAVLRLFGEVDRAPEELYTAGALSAGARRVARALEEADDALSTGVLRERAGFPTGKEERAAYLKAVAELEERLMLAKVFSGREGDTEMYHVLVASRYAESVAAARLLGRETALDTLLVAYLPSAVYAVPKPLARHLRLPAAELIAGLERAVSDGAATREGALYVTTATDSEEDAR